ncbi:hypothetical protein DES43_108151 [Aquamicrobium defluvii]|uniref:Uncharacterized protein n=1 Tax=Aquamicrobium defluvii TaxID=69279 RepID=A0A4R6YGQ4_9HYPH|nr:hypothetical protein DES43_108151 [Aquamicrobium defluvii]
MLQVLAIMLGSIFAIGYFVVANIVIATVSADAEKARQWLLGLFIANFLLIGFLVGKIFP